MSDPTKPGNMPAFPTFGVTRAGEHLSADFLPAPPETPPVSADRAEQLLLGDQAAQQADAPMGPLLLLDDDFFGAMDCADALAAASGQDVRSAMSDQKALALLDEEPPCLVVLSIQTPGAQGVAAEVIKRGIPMVLLSDNGTAGPAAAAYPDCPVLQRGAGQEVVKSLLDRLLTR